MNELLISLVHGGNWTDRERRIGRWIRNILVVMMAVGALAWNYHWQKLGAQNVVWTTWVNTQCQTGIRDTCMSYVDFALPSGMPANAFWTSHPELEARARCVERMGWLTLSAGRKNYADLLDMCEGAPLTQQQVRAPQS